MCKGKGAFEVRFFRRRTHVYNRTTLMVGYISVYAALSLSGERVRIIFELRKEEGTERVPKYISGPRAM